MESPLIPDDWKALLGDFEARLERARGMGGEQKLHKRSASGKPNAREMIGRMTDPGSFMELGTLVGGVSYHGEATVAADALVGGLARIDGRPVVIGCEDFTSAGGSIGHGASAKRVRLAHLARDARCPYIMVLDGAGARVSNSLERHPYAPNDLQVLAELSGLVPTVAVVLGSSAGHGVLTGLLMDYIIALEDATLFSAGPPLVAAAMGEMVSKEELGSAAMHARESGVVHNLARDAAHAAELLRGYLAHLPSHAWERAPRASGADQGPRSLDDIFQLIPRSHQRPYDVRPVIARVADAGAFYEFQPAYGTSLVTGFIHLGGHSCAVVANQPAVLAGAITAQAAEKAAHFIELADAWHLPVLFLADNPGIMPGTQAERAGTLRAAARMFAAQARLRSPKLHVTLRKAFGFGSSLMAMNPFDRQTITLALPGVSLGGIPALGGAMATGMDAAALSQLEEAQASSAWTTADTMAYDEVIDPRQLRNALLASLLHSCGRLDQDVAPAAHTGIRP